MAAGIPAAAERRRRQAAAVVVLHRKGHTFLHGIQEKFVRELSHDSAANLGIVLDKSTKWRPELPLANSVLVSFYPLCSWSDRCGRRERITEKWKNFSRLQERDDAPISAGNSNFYGKNLLLGLIQGINKKEGEN